MPSRTFKQQGQGYGATPVSVVATIDNNIVYSGTVPTVNQPLLQPGDPLIEVDAFSWPGPANTAGVFAFTLSVTGGYFVMAATVANWVKIVAPDQPGGYGSLGPNFYSGLWDQTQPKPAVTDPVTNVFINGVEQIVTDRAPYFGQWYWTLNDGDVLTCNITYPAGLNIWTLSNPAD